MNFASPKPALLWLLFLWQASPQSAVPVAPGSVAPSVRFRYQRAIHLAPESSSAAKPVQACAVLDAEVFAHAAPSLKDLRLYSGATEIAYATTVSEPLQQESEDARILNLRSQSGHILFDLEMPHRPYTGLNLDLAAHDYIAKAAVSGTASPGRGSVTRLGSFTLFDLTSQRLSHSTEIPLPESTFPYLHLDLVLTPAPGSAATTASLELPVIVRAAVVPPSREAQSIYTTTQRQTSLVKDGQDSVATFQIPARVPVERIVFSLPAGYKGSFSRAVRIEAQGMADAGSSTPDTAAAFKSEDVTGIILRVHKSEAGHELSAEDLSIPVSIGSNMQQPAMVKVRVENGPEPPLPIAAVELQMRQRRICFDARSAVAPLNLYYGDPTLEAPAYNDAALSQAVANPRIAELGPEGVNRDVVSASPARRVDRPRPVLRWIALLGCVCVFALFVIRRSHRRPR